jgi:4'-phosphopantetheinyl transferase
MSPLASVSELKAEQIHIWFANIDRPPSDIRHFEALLSPREASRAQRFQFMRDRNGYVVRHGVLRTLLAGYLNCEPRQVNILYESNGKPHLAAQRNEGSLQFSDSHSDTYAAFAFCRYSRIGVDIEKIRELPEMLEIVARHFTRRENAELLSCPEAGRVMLFYQLWTRKEAILKAQGEGLLRHLDSVDVATDRRGPGPWQVAIAGCPTGESFWVADINGPAGFMVAVAVAGCIAEISIHPSGMSLAWFDRRGSGP